MATEVREDCVFVRIETGATAWALSARALASLAAVPWLRLQLGLSGLHGVAPAGEGWAERLGQWVREEDALADVEIRERVALVETPVPMAEVGPALERWRNRVHAIFAGDGGCALVIDGDVASEVARVVTA